MFALPVPCRHEAVLFQPQISICDLAHAGNRLLGPELKGMTDIDQERQRMEDARNRRPGADWRRWGPYVSAREWGTVREDYSTDGAAWDYLPHDQARSKAYRWNEDGLAAICDSSQELCFGLTLWNGKDAILKERPFGLSGPQGNHGEDVKEYWFYPRQPADACLHEDALQVPAGGLPV